MLTSLNFPSLMGIQSRLYKNLYPLVLYDFSYENEISAPPSSPFAKNEFDPFNDPRHHRLLSTMTYIRLLLGLDDRIDDMSLVRLAREMSMLRAISVKEKGKHPADWEHPVTLMHVSWLVVSSGGVGELVKVTLPFTFPAQSRVSLCPRPEPNRRFQRLGSFQNRQGRLRRNCTCLDIRSAMQHVGR